MGTETTYFACFIIYTPLYVHEKFFKAINFKSETKSTFKPMLYPFMYMCIITVWQVCLLNACTGIFVSTVS